MGILVLPYELKKVSARLVKTEKKYANYINNICEFEDIEYTNDLFLKMSGESLDFGSIEHTEMYFRAGREYWEITTTKSYFKFEILNKPQWREIPREESEEIINELSNKRFFKEFNKVLDVFLNKEYEFGSTLFSWKRKYKY